MCQCVCSKLVLLWSKVNVTVIPGKTVIEDSCTTDIIATICSELARCFWSGCLKNWDHVCDHPQSASVCKATENGKKAESVCCQFAIERGQVGICVHFVSGSTAIKCNTLAQIPNLFPLSSRQNPIDMKQKFINSSTNGDVVAARWQFDCRIL